MKIDFSPLAPEAKAYLSTNGIDFTHVDMASWFCVTATDERDEIAGVLACQLRGGFDWRFNTVITDQRCMSRRLLLTIFRTLFHRGARITALVEPGNRRAVNQMHRMGFVYEGFKRRGIDGVRDGLMFGLLPEDCPYLSGFDPARTSMVAPTHHFGGLHG